jgi:hypothetical protein
MYSKRFTVNVYLETTENKLYRLTSVKLAVSNINFQVYTDGVVQTTPCWVVTLRRIINLLGASE